MTGSAEMDAGPRSCFMTAVRKASRRLTQVYDETLAPSGLRATQFSILAELAIRTGSPPTLTQLADDLVADRSSVGHALRPLVRDGYVCLRRAAGDRRAQQILLTEGGRDKFREAMTYWQVAQTMVLSLYGEEGARNLRATILEIAHDERLGKLTQEVAR